LCKLIITTTGTAVGAELGSKVGGAIGSVGGPLGAVVGGVVGAALGFSAWVFYSVATGAYINEAGKNIRNGLKTGVIVGVAAGSFLEYDIIKTQKSDIPKLWFRDIT